MTHLSHCSNIITVVENIYYYQFKRYTFLYDKMYSTPLSDNFTLATLRNVTTRSLGS